MHFIMISEVNRSNVTSSFRGIWTSFFFLSIDKRSTLAKIWGVVGRGGGLQFLQFLRFLRACFLSSISWFRNLIINNFSFKHTLQRLCWYLHKLFLQFFMLLLEICFFVLVPIPILTVQLHYYIFNVCYLLHGCYICLWRVFQILLKKPSFHYLHSWRHLLSKQFLV